MKKILLLILALAFIFIIGCQSQSYENNAKNADAYFCNANSDCEIKDVHNCCGYYPRCVNKGYIPDIEAVMRKCEQEGMASICGFPDITNCKCIDNECKSMQGNEIV